MSVEIDWDDLESIKKGLKELSCELEPPKNNDRSKFNAGVGVPHGYFDQNGKFIDLEKIKLLGK